MLNRPGHILVADHQGNLDRFVCNVVGQDHWLIERVESITELEAKCLDTIPDIIVLSAHLPKLQIAELSKRLTQKNSDGRKPFLILAIAKDPEVHLKKGIQRLVDEVLIAPFYGVELLTKIHNFNRVVQEPAQAAARPDLPKIPDITAEPPASRQPAPASIVSIGKFHQGARIEKLTAEESQKRESQARPVTPIRSAAAKRSVKVESEKNLLGAKNRTPEKQSSADLSIRKKMTLLLVKINGLEKAMEDFDPAQSITSLNLIYKIISEEILPLGGKVISKHGDIVVLLFSNSTIVSNHRISAIQAAMQLQLSAMFLGDSIGSLGEHLNLSCVLHTSMMTLGYGQDVNTGETTVIGSALPLAMRLLEFSPASQILATHECYSEIAQHVCIAEEYVLNHENTPENGLQFAVISGLDAPEYALRALPKKATA